MKRKQATLIGLVKRTPRSHDRGNDPANPVVDQVEDLVQIPDDDPAGPVDVPVQIPDDDPIANIVHGRTLKKQNHTENYIATKMKQFPDLKLETVIKDAKQTKIYYCRLCRNAHGKLPSNKQWVFCSGFPDGRKLEHAELKEHFHKHNYHQAAIKIMSNSQSLEVIQKKLDRKELELSSLDKTRLALMIEDLYVIAKTNKPISFASDLLDLFDAKINVLQHSEILNTEADSIKEKLGMSSKDLQRYAKQHCCLMALGKVIHKSRLNTFDNLTLFSFTCDGTFQKGRELEVMLVFHEVENHTGHKLTFIQSEYLENLKVDGEEKFIRSSLGKIKGIGVSCCIDGPNKHTGHISGLLVALEMTEAGVICTPHTADLPKQHLVKSSKLVMAVISLTKGIANELNEFYVKKAYIEATKTLQLPYLQYITFPITRWSYITQVCKRHIKVIPVLHTVYENLAATDSSMKGRLAQLQDIKIVHAIHIILSLLIFLVSFRAL